MSTQVMYKSAHPRTDLSVENSFSIMLLLLSLDAHNHVDDYCGTLDPLKNKTKNKSDANTVIVILIVVKVFCNCARLVQW